MILWILSHGLEVVRIEGVVLSYKDLELFPPPPLEKLVLKTVEWNVIIIVVVVVVDDNTYYWVYWSSDHPFQVYYKVRQVF